MRIFEKLWSQFFPSSTKKKNFVQIPDDLPQQRGKNFKFLNENLKFYVAIPIHFYNENFKFSTPKKSTPKCSNFSVFIQCGMEFVERLKLINQIKLQNCL